MLTFEQYIMEMHDQQAKQQVEELKQHLQKWMSPESVAQIVQRVTGSSLRQLKQSGEAGFGEFLDKLLSNKHIPERIQQIKTSLAKAKSQMQQQRTEGVLHEGFFSALKTIWDYTLGPIVKWLFSSVTKTLANIFGVGSDNKSSFATKALCAAGAIALLGIPTAMLGVSGGLIGAGSFFVLAWLYTNIVDPILTYRDG